VGFIPNKNDGKKQKQKKKKTNTLNASLRTPERFVDPDGLSFLNIASTDAAFVIFGYLLNPEEKK